MQFSNSVDKHETYSRDYWGNTFNKKIGTEHKIDTHKIQSFLRDFEDAPLTHSYVISDLSHVSHFLRLLSRRSHHHWDSLIYLTCWCNSNKKNYGTNHMYIFACKWMRLKMEIKQIMWQYYSKVDWWAEWKKKSLMWNSYWNSKVSWLTFDIKGKLGRWRFMSKPFTPRKQLS